jgi:hypothetical protein
MYSAVADTWITILFHIELSSLRVYVHSLPFGLHTQSCLQAYSTSTGRAPSFRVGWKLKRCRSIQCLKNLVVYTYGSWLSACKLSQNRLFLVSTRKTCKNMRRWLTGDRAILDFFVQTSIDLKYATTFPYTYQTRETSNVCLLFQGRSQPFRKSDLLRESQYYMSTCTNTADQSSAAWWSTKAGMHPLKMYRACVFERPTTFPMLRKNEDTLHVASETNTSECSILRIYRKTVFQLTQVKKTRVQKNQTSLIDKKIN